MANGGVWTKIYPASSGGGKVLQVVYAEHTEAYRSQQAKGTTRVPVDNMSLTVSNIQPGSTIYLFAGLLLQAYTNGNQFNRVHANIVDGDGNEVSGAKDGRVGNTSYKYLDGFQPTHDQYTTLLARDANPGASKSYQVQMWSEAENITCTLLASANPPIFYAMEVGE